MSPRGEARRDLTSAFNSYIWDRNLKAAPWWSVVFFSVLRTLFVLVRDLKGGELNLRAMSLVYTTLLSLVPLLAISFSILKGFGVHNEIGPFLFNLLEPLGEKGQDITLTIIDFVERMKVGVLGSIGLVLLLYTVISVMQKVERAFNFIWQIRESRPIAQRFSDYISVILVGPMLIVASTGISATAMNSTLVKSLTQIQPLGWLIEVSVVFVPLVLSIAAFSFFYVFIPNTKVKIKSALIGAVVASILWKLTGWIFANVVVTSTQYEAVYSAFASLIFFMIWLYLTWLILMIGASVAFYHQHPEYLSGDQSKKLLSSRMKEYLSLLVMGCIGTNFYSGKAAWSLEGLADKLNVPVEAIDSILNILEIEGFVVKTKDVEQCYIPGRPFDTTPLEYLISAVKVAEETEYIGPAGINGQTDIDQIGQEMDKAISNALKGKMIKDLISSEIDEDHSFETVPIQVKKEATLRR